jgi:hypothetical protein
MIRILTTMAFLTLLTTLSAQVDTCFTSVEIKAIYESKQAILQEVEKLRNIDATQQRIISEYEIQRGKDSLTIDLYLQTQEELLRLNEHYKNGLKNATREDKWYQTRFVAYLGGMTAALVGAVGIRLASK